MDELIQAIKQIAVEAVQSQKPNEVVFGTVSSINPLKITIDQKITVSGDFLIVMKQFQGSYFELNNKVVMLQCNRGQKYLILGKGE